MTRGRLSKAEIRKDAVQEGIEATATTVGAVATIITGAIRDVTKAVGGLGTELFEIRDAARRADDDRPVQRPGDLTVDPHDEIAARREGR